MTSLSTTSGAGHKQQSWSQFLDRRGPILVIAGILALAVAIVVDEWRTSTALPGGPTLAREVVFEARADGKLAVRDFNDGGEIAVLPSASEGFIAMTVKGLSRGRRAYNVADSEPYRITRRSSGHVALTDPVTGAHIELAAFGTDNQAAFAKLLERRKNVP